jgi:hypothetical protein
MKLDAEDVAVVRHKTTPRNIRFEWRQDEDLERASLDVSRKEKALVYIDSIDNGTMLKDQFGWPFYHAKDRITSQSAEMFYGVDPWQSDGGTMIATEDR